MRLRNKNWTKEYIEKNSQYIIKQINKINPLILFDTKNPVFLEIGCGKGQFIIKQSIKNEKRNFIAMEKETTVIGVALKQAINTEECKMNNLLFLNTYAENLLDIFEPNTLNGIYLNFSDPWPKSRHEKKRLTYVKFLDIYWNLLQPNGFIEIKTDNDNLYNFTIEQIEKSKFKLIDYTSDLYNTPVLLEDNIATEYEQKFHAMGKNINKIIIKKEI